MLKETTQIGAELIGDGSAEADAELLALVFMMARYYMERKKHPLGEALPAQTAPHFYRTLFSIAIPVTIGASMMPIVNLVDASLVVNRLTHIGYELKNAREMYGVLTGMVNTMVNMPAVITLSFSMSLANELRPFGITVICIQPGDIKTGFTSARVKTAAGDDVYDGRISRSVSKMEYDEQTGMPPEAAGKFIAKAAIGSSKRPVRTIGFSYKVVCFLTKILPLGLMNKIIGKLYAD